MLTIEHATGPDRDFLALVARLDAELTAKNGAEVQARFNPLNGLGGLERFFVARWDGRAIGTAALKPREEGRAEVKRVYTDPAFRGRGTAKALMGALEAWARDRGYRELVLETSASFTEAVGLYTALGFRRCPAFAPYLDSPLSACFSKFLPES